MDDYVIEFKIKDQQYVERIAQGSERETGRSFV
jgi:hypothetical protein